MSSMDECAGNAFDGRLNLRISSIFVVSTVKLRQRDASTASLRGDVDNRYKTWWCDMQFTVVTVKHYTEYRSGYLPIRNIADAVLSFRSWSGQP